MPIDANKEAFDHTGCDLVAQVLRGSRKVRIRAQGSSMIPAVWPGDIIEIEPACLASVNEGDIAVFGREGRIFAHRVVRKGAAELTTRGDSLSYCDAPVMGSEFLGRVTIAIRNGRRVLLAREPRNATKVVSSVIRSSNLMRRVVVGLHSRLRRLQFAMRKASA